MASVFLIAWVDSDQEEKVVKDLALSKGLVVPSRAGNRRDVGIPQHVSRLSGQEICLRVQSSLTEVAIGFISENITLSPCVA